MNKKSLLLLSFALLASCSSTKNTVNYANSDKYLYGNKTYTDTVNEVDIKFLCGDLLIEKGDDLSISEEGEHEEKLAVHHLVEDKLLTVYDTGVGKINGNYDKNVTIKIPNELDKLTVDSVANNVESSVDVKVIDIDVTNGDFKLTSTILEELNINIINGDIDLYIPKDKTLDLKSDQVNGEIYGDYKTGDDIKINYESVNGNLTIHTIE